MIDKDDVEFSHPSYGMVGFNRWQGSDRLFGSAVHTHHGISLTIKRATRQHHLYQDWYHGRGEIVRVEMTEAQFAQLITSMGQGDGVPCTLKWITGEGQIAPEKTNQSEAELIHARFKAEAKIIADRLKSSSQSVKDIANNSKMSQKDKRAITDAVDAFSNEAQNHMPFLLSQLTESAERIITQVKTEVVAFTERTLKAVGLSHMKEEAPKLIEKYGEGLGPTRAAIRIAEGNNGKH